jgi:hypothetical protein
MVVKLEESFAAKTRPFAFKFAEFNLLRDHNMNLLNCEDITSYKNNYVACFEFPDHLCGLVAADTEVPGSIPGAARFSK